MAQASIRRLAHEPRLLALCRLSQGEAQTIHYRIADARAVRGRARVHDGCRPRRRRRSP